jgi:capsular polysaccharide transport system ATP-binding protein
VITLSNISKAYRTAKGWNQVLDNISVTFPSGRSVGILGLNGSGKSTLLRLIGGVESPDKGEITRDVNVSWPIGFSGGFLPFATGRESTRFISRIYGASIQDIEAFVEEFSELGEYYDMPYNTYSSGMRARLAFAISMAMEFDCYLVDEATAVGDQRFRDKYQEAFAERHSRSTVIMASHQAHTIKEFCNMSAILFNSRITLYDSVEEGMTAYNELIRSIKRPTSKDQPSH